MPRFRVALFYPVLQVIQYWETLTHLLAYILDLPRLLKIVDYANSPYYAVSVAKLFMPRLHLLQAVNDKSNPNSRQNVFFMGVPSVVNVCFE
jgi:hypothetical protein